MGIRIGHLGSVATFGALLVALCAAAQLSAQKGNGGHTETYGNNLSFPVIWAEGVQKTLREPISGQPELNGTWWYWWGTDEVTGDPMSCPPDPDDQTYCDNGLPGSVGDPPGTGWYKVYFQQDSGNVWQAGTYPAYGEPGTTLDPVVVDWIDWGDNLEAVNWFLNSKVRTEVVLIEDLDGGLGEPPAGSMTQYMMRHLYGLGINEMHGLSTTGGQAERIDPNLQATVYSHCARFVIQRLIEDRDSPSLSVTWDPALGYWTGTVNEPIFNGSVWEGGDGPGYYSAEINVKGKIIYGYTWNVLRLNDGKGDYRLTFVLDSACPSGLNTYFDTSTQILLPVETEEAAAEAEPGEEPNEGGVAAIDTAANLTYIDIRILDKKGGGKKIWR